MTDTARDLLSLRRSGPVGFTHIDARCFPLRFMGLVRSRVTLARGIVCHGTPPRGRVPPTESQGGHHESQNGFCTRYSTQDCRRHRKSGPIARNDVRDFGP